MRPSVVSGFSRTLIALIFLMALTVTAAQQRSVAVPGQPSFRSEIGPRSGLGVLATETGGFMIKDTNNFDGAFDRILRENSLYKNDIKLARGGLHALYRPGYTAPSHD